MKSAKIAVPVLLLVLVLIGAMPLRGQGLNLDSLYVSRPSPDEVTALIDSFHITLEDGPESHAKWLLYDPYLFRPDSTAPSIFPLLNKLRVIREQRFAVPLPFAANNVFDYMLGHFRNGSVILSLRTGSPVGGGNVINLNANQAFWDARSSSDPFTPFPTFSVYHYIYGVQLLVHETRHSDPDDPGHVGGMDARLADEGGYGRACIYLMWVYKYGMNNSAGIKAAAAWQAQDFLRNRFVEQPASHPDAAIQTLVEEILQATIPATRADAGPDQTIIMPAGITDTAVLLDGSGSYDISSPIVEYRWFPQQGAAIITADPKISVRLGIGTQQFVLVAVSGLGSWSAPDTVLISVVPTPVSVADAAATIPQEVRLFPNYPNPFNPVTVIEYSVPTRLAVTLEVSDLLGREVTILVDGLVETGRHRVLFDGSRLSSGSYFYRLRAGGHVQTRPMQLVR